MGRKYVPVELKTGRNRITTVAIVDTGADESVISDEKAREIGAKLFGEFLAACASNTVIVGRYTEVEIRVIGTDRKAKLRVGVSDVPFHTDDINEEGVNAILGVDYLQLTDSTLTFSS